MSAQPSNRQVEDGGAQTESPAAMVGWLGIIVLGVAALVLAGFADHSSSPLYLLQWVRVALLAGMLFGVIKGSRFAWAASVTLFSSYCVIGTLLVSLSILNGLGGALFRSGIAALSLSIIASLIIAGIVLSPVWIFLGGAALTLWHHRCDYQVDRHQRFRLLVTQGLPVTAASLLLDGPWIAQILTERMLP